MCPECLASTALMVSGIVSTGGVGALAVTMLRSTLPIKKSRHIEPTDSEQRRTDHGNSDNEQTSAQDRHA